MPVASTMIRNKQSGTTVYSPNASPKDYIVWERSGDPNGGDVMPVSEEVLSQPQFQRILQRGVLEIVSDEAMIKTATDAQIAHWNERQSHGETQAAESIEHAVQNDLVMATCVGPSTRGDGKCGTEVSVKESELATRPPLCSQHASLASSFIPEVGQNDEGKTVTNWLRVTMGDRERQQ